MCPSYYRIGWSTGAWFECRPGNRLSWLSPNLRANNRTVGTAASKLSFIRYPTSRYIAWDTNSVPQYRAHMQDNAWTASNLHRVRHIIRAAQITTPSLCLSKFVNQCENDGICTSNFVGTKHLESQSQNYAFSGLSCYHHGDGSLKTTELSLIPFYRIYINKRGHAVA
jgi:hypothetical protein